MSKRVETIPQNKSLVVYCRSCYTILVLTCGGSVAKWFTPLYGPYRYVRPQRVWFSAVSVINRVSILATLPPFCPHFGHK